MTSITASRLVLEGVPHIGFDVYQSPFPGSMYALLSYLGDRHEYEYLMGVTGAAFRRLWNRDDGGNIDLSKFGPKPFRLAFDALGYNWHAVPADKQAMQAAILESLRRGMPLISFGILAPPEAGLVTGYEQDSDTLNGWSYFQPDGSQTYKINNWFETLQSGQDPFAKSRALIVIDGKRPTTPAPETVLATSLKWALDLERTSSRAEIPDHACGLAAYEAWASSLEVDADYPPDNPAVMEMRAGLYSDQCTMLEERHNAAGFLRRMIPCAQRAAVDLEDAAARYQEAGNLVFKLWPWAYDSNAGPIQGLPDARTRRELASVIRTAGQKESQAVACLEKALQALR